LEDSKLRAPFSGRITQIHVTQGAVVDVGMPVVTLSLMDPIQVQVEVSADEDRRLQTGDRAILYPNDPIDPEGKPAQINALVYEKGEVADPNTRTYRIDLMARNERRRIEQIKPETKGLPHVADFLPVVRRYHGEVGKLYVPIDSIYYENGKHFVLRLPGVSFHSGAKRSAVGKHIPDKVEVSLDDDYFTVIKWNFRSLKDSSDLQEGDFLALDPRKEHLAGLAIGRPQWLLRPGDLVPVSFLLHSTTKGLYVPVNAITLFDDKHVVFLVEDNKAVLKEITVHDSYRELRRIEGAGIEQGAQVIVGGVHYISDKQPVTIVGQETLLK
ncbi:MAG: HlyD family efflux transporter periplasmic adaptor subunit, partial [Gammaproteobacteria bacterium]